MKKVDAKRFIKNFLKDYDDPEDENLTENEELADEGFDESMEEGSFKGALSEVRDVGYSVALPRGIALVASEPKKAWKEIERWWVLETLTVHLIGPQFASHSQCLLAYAMALAEDEPANWMAASMRASMAEEPRAWKKRPFSRFMDHLHRVYGPDKKAGPGAVKDLGPYQAVLEAWDDPDALATALSGALDFRVATAANEKDDDDSEFGFAPIIPFEIPAIAQIRSGLGLPMPDVAHPLMDTPFAAIPTKRSYDPAKDPWFKRALKAAVAGKLVPKTFAWPD